MSANRPDLDAIERDLVDALETVRERCHAEPESVEDNAMIAIECFCKIALEVFRKVPANRIRAVARHLELRARYAGAEVLTLEKTP